MKDIDQFDSPFVALTIELGGTLWTGDKKLKKGLGQAGFQEVIETQNLVKLREELDK